MIFFRMFQHLLPRAKAWSLTAEKNLRNFFLGLTGVGANVKLFIDLIWFDLLPQFTRRLDDWDAQFNLPDTVLTEQERRDRLAAAWQALGGQSPRYIQDTLQAAGFDVYVHEWWWNMPTEIVVSGTGTTADATYELQTFTSDGNAVWHKQNGNFLSIIATGVDGDQLPIFSLGLQDGSDAWEVPVVEYSPPKPKAVPPKTGWSVSKFNSYPAPTLSYPDLLTARNPHDYLRRNASFVRLYGAGEAFMQAGEAQAVAGDGVTLPGYALVNNIFESQVNWLSLAGEDFMQAGEAQAVSGDFLEYVEALKDYTIPADPNTWPFFFYIGGEIFGDLATIPPERRGEFETLCLKICPTQLWLGILVDYT